MRVVLTSADARLRQLCRNVLDELGGGCEFFACDFDPAAPAGDLHVWDFSPSLVWPARIEATELWRHLFVVSREDLPAFSQTRLSGGLVALKPLGRAMLRAFLDQASHPAMESRICRLREDRDEILECLMRANLKLQEYDHERTNFIARALHDFRAPLTTLTGYCGLLRSLDLGPLTQDQTDALRRMENSARRLARLASGMFQLSITSRVDQTPHLAAGDIGECVLQALHEIRPFAEERRIDLSASIVPNPGSLWFDASGIEQLLVNLLENACKFTPKAGKIQVTGKPFFWDRRGTGDPTLPVDRRAAPSCSPNSYLIDITDSGETIPENRLTSIFEEYTRSAGSNNRSGAGLGLAICGMIVRQHHGRLWAQNGPSGPTFSVILPFQASATDTALRPQAPAEILVQAGASRHEATN